MGRRISGMLHYATVERVLADVHGIDEAGFGAFRGRLQHLQKLGLSPERPGKGRRIEYTDDFVCVWSFALQFLELGIAPNVTVAFARSSEGWQSIQWGFSADEESKGDRFVIFDPRVLQNDAVMVRLATRKELLEKLAEFDRAVVVNCSRLRRRIVKAHDAVKAEMRETGRGREASAA
jgi:hypothetical protein